MGEHQNIEKLLQARGNILERQVRPVVDIIEEEIADVEKERDILWSQALRARTTLLGLEKKELTTELHRWSSQLKAPALSPIRKSEAEYMQGRLNFLLSQNETNQTITQKQGEDRSFGDILDFDSQVSLIDHRISVLDAIKKTVDGTVAELFDSKDDDTYCRHGLLVSCHQEKELLLLQKEWLTLRNRADALLTREEKLAIKSSLEDINASIEEARQALASTNFKMRRLNGAAERIDRVQQSGSYDPSYAEPEQLKREKDLVGYSISFDLGNLMLDEIATHREPLLDEMDRTTIRSSVKSAVNMELDEWDDQHNDLIDIHEKLFLDNEPVATTYVDTLQNEVNRLTNNLNATASPDDPQLPIIAQRIAEFNLGTMRQRQIARLIEKIKAGSVDSSSTTSSESFERFATDYLKRSDEFDSVTKITERLSVLSGLSSNEEQPADRFERAAIRFELTHTWVSFQLDDVKERLEKHNLALLGTQEELEERITKLKDRLQQSGPGRGRIPLAKAELILRQKELKLKNEQRRWNREKEDAQRLCNLHRQLADADQPRKAALQQQIDIATELAESRSRVHETTAEDELAALRSKIAIARVKLSVLERANTSAPDETMAMNALATATQQYAQKQKKLNQLWETLQPEQTKRVAEYRDALEALNKRTALVEATIPGSNRDDEVQAIKTAVHKLREPDGQEETLREKQTLCSGPLGDFFGHHTSQYGDVKKLLKMTDRDLEKLADLSAHTTDLETEVLIKLQPDSQNWKETIARKQAEIIEGMIERGVLKSQSVEHPTEEIKFHPGLFIRSLAGTYQFAAFNRKKGTLPTLPKLYDVPPQAQQQIKQFETKLGRPLSPGDHLNFTIQAEKQNLLEAGKQLVRRISQGKLR